MKLQWCVYPYHCTVAPNWGGRTPGSQTPGVPAALDLNVQMYRRQEADPAQLQLCLPVSVTTEVSTDSGDELNQWHFHCRETTCRCKITATSTIGGIATAEQGSARRGRCPPCPPRRAAVPAPAAAPQREVSAEREEESSGPWRRTTRLSPPPWPWLSSGSLGRYGASLQPGPWRRSSVHTASMHGGVAPADVWRHRRVQLHQPPT